MLWNDWWLLVCELRSACARTRSFLWMCVCLAGFSIRKDLLGVTSIVRALGLEPACYDRLLDFFHSPALDLNQLTLAWCALVFRVHPGILRFNGRPVLVADGIKVAKAGRKMPGVTKLHPESDSNNKPVFIFGHSGLANTHPEEGAGASAGGAQIAYQQPPIVAEHARPPEPVGWDVSGVRI